MKQMNGRSKTNGGKMLMGSGYGRQKMAAGTQPAEQNHCRRTQPADSPPGTGLEANGPQLAGFAAKTQLPDDIGLVQVSGGSAVVLATMKAGADLPTLSLPQLTPLPVTVPTHSLNFEQPNLAPN